MTIVVTVKDGIHIYKLSSKSEVIPFVRSKHPTGKLNIAVTEDTIKVTDHRVKY